MKSLPRLLVITDWSLPERTLLSRLAIVLGAGPVAIQHRDPGSPTRLFLSRARKVMALCEAAGAPLFVNGRVDVALLLGAHLHLPSRGPSVSWVRPLLPKGRLISAAVHSVREARDAAGADFALVSPVFPPTSKPGDPRRPLGPSGFTRVAGAFSGPAFALGGMGPASPEVAGAYGVAVVGAVLHARDPGRAVAGLNARFGSPRRRPYNGARD